MACATTIVNPGMTIFDSYTFPKTEPLLFTDVSERKVVLLATQNISYDNIFSNGLFQNVIFIYEMMEVMGFSTFLLVNTKDSKDDSNSEFRKYRTIVSEEIVRNPMPIYAYVEIGMSVSSALRVYLRSIGAKIVKLYLGNILNIDVETIQSTPGLFFPHHIVGDLDEIWTSPHYGQNRDYATVLNRVPIEMSQIAPYVWDPLIITDFGKNMIRWKRPSDWKTSDIVIVEPNISFQKSYMLPLLLVNSFAENNPEWRGSVILMNADVIKKNVHAVTAVLPKIKLYTDGRVKMNGRKTILEIVKDNPSAVFVCHQFNNDFNYMTFELMYMGFPLLHTSSAWADFGYKWSEIKWKSAQDTLKLAVKNHHTVADSYTAHSRQLLWHHSIHNPENHKGWKKILGGI